MTARIDITGKRFGRWTVLSYAGDRKWNCRCNCGTERAVDGASLRKGLSTGCLKCHPRGHSKRIHGKQPARLYNIWCGIIDRCENLNCHAYPRYGGRGISMCPEWRRSFECFRDWALTNGYAPNLTIDRRDNDGHYEPNNCRWVTYAEQNRNYSRNRPIQYRGRTVLVCDLAVEVGLPQDILKNRIFRYGWPIEEAAATPVMRKGEKRCPPAHASTK